MNKDIFRPILEKRKKVLDEIVDNTIGLHKKYYFDYTASGLGFSTIESRIHEVLLTYANTHSKEATMAAQTDFYYNEARTQIKNSLEIDDEFAILPCGYGATSAIKRLQEILGIYIPPATRKRFKLLEDSISRPLVITGPYEHHSNEISYREALCDCIRVKITDKGTIDLKHLESILRNSTHIQIIGTFCIASNVTGIITPYEKISKLLRKYNAIVCFDAAASSAYMNVACSLYDAMFLSPHKLLGGPGSCGILVVKKELIDNTLAPTFAGGGTVEYVDRGNHNFIDEKEVREDAGTPGVLQLIRAALAYQLRNEVGLLWIKKRKKYLLHHLLEGLNKIDNCKVYGNFNVQNIGNISLNIQGFDPYAICENLSEKYALQTRAGCSCAGPYGHDLLGMNDNSDLQSRPGWLRISVHYSQNIDTIDYLLASLKEYTDKA